ncbi:hypothetical protein MPDQ_003459 [Monascus purpureus]|uniref:Uncharacterized protein n=1 Tax=Monascus purpureus TaxID=5098 RepID=A0A507R2Z8_MONPU|nr:hypothetical protein MPDQ_003459 [Monascus purpureus]BDD57110.1 hypothetical protein MAP00_002504 [Monascus purpureus]
MPQTQPLKDKPLHSHPEPLKDRSNVSNDTLKSSRYDGFVKGSPPRMHRGAKKPNGNGTGAAVSTETLRGAYAATRLTTGAASSIPIKPISAANPLTTISATTSSPAATTANSPTSGNIIGGHRRRRSSFFEEWSSPLSSVRGPSPEKGRQRNASSTTSPSRSSVASAGAPVAAASKTIRGPISKELITGMAPLPAPSTVVAKAPASATSAPGAASTTLKTVPAKAASVTTSTTAPNTARGAAPTAVSSAAPAVRSSPAPKPNCAPDRNITSATSPSRIPMSKTAPVPTKATVTAPASALDRKDGDTKNSSLPPKDRKPSVSGTTRGRTTEPTKTPSPPASTANTLTKKELSPESNETRSKPGIPEGSYRTPRGFIINKIELNRLSGGVKNARRDTIYFRVSFLEDPWQGLKPVKTACLERWW